MLGRRAGRVRMMKAAAALGYRLARCVSGWPEDAAVFDSGRWPVRGHTFGSFGCTAAPEAQAAADAAPVPTPRQASAAPRTRPRKKATAQSKKTAAKTSAAGEASAAKTAPTLGELIREHLSRQTEPRSAAEVTAALAQTIERAMAALVRMLRLLNVTDTLALALAQAWDGSAAYTDAATAVRRALAGDQLNLPEQNTAAVSSMSMHRSKGKEFDGVVIAEGAHHSRLLDVTWDEERIRANRPPAAGGDHPRPPHGGLRPP